MNLDDRICYCFHVPLRKLYHFARRERPARASRLSECLGAGTGCGWCIPVLKKIHHDVSLGVEYVEGISVEGLPLDAAGYADARKTYLTSKEKHAF